MRILSPLPAAIGRYADIFGPLLIAPFEDADGDVETALDAIDQVVPVNREELRRLGYREIDDDAFFGDWYEPSSRSLLLRGEYTTKDGRKLVNARLRDLDGVEFQHGGSALPECGAGGNFGYAFAHPPYGLSATQSEVQALFDKITDIVLPRHTPHVIWDWTSPDLPKVSNFFDAGMEWWGVFLFTVYVPEQRRLSVIVGSTTD